MPLIIALAATAVTGVLALRGLVDETGDEIDRNTANLVALAVAGAALWLVLRR